MNDRASTGRRTRSMNEELQLVVPAYRWLPVYRVTGKWETLVESRRALEWVRGICGVVLFMIMIPPSAAKSGLVEALHVYALFLALPVTTAALDALWAARHATELELVDRASSGFDEWRARRAEQREPELVVLGVLVFGGSGAWMLWAALRPDAAINPWIFVPMGLLLIHLPVQSVLAKLRRARRVDA